MFVPRPDYSHHHPCFQLPLLLLQYSEGVVLLHTLLADFAWWTHPTPFSLQHPQCCFLWLQIFELLHLTEALERNKMFLVISKSLSPKLILLRTGLLPVRPSQKLGKLFCLFSQPSLCDHMYYPGPFPRIFLLLRNLHKYFLCCISARLVILSEESQFDCMNWLSWTGQPSKMSRLLVNVFWLNQKSWTQWLREKEETNPTLWWPFQFVDCLEIS